MPLFLDEQCVSGLVTMQDALEVVEEAFREQGASNVINVPRVRAPLRDGVLRITAAVLSYRGLYGVKVSSTAVFGRNSGRMFSLYREDSGELCAVVQVFAMGTLRTGAASGVATKHLANESASILGVIGTGRQARTQIDAIRQVRPIREVRVYSRNPDHRQRFCADVGSTSGIKATAVDEPEQAVRGCHIVVTATTATAPVLMGRWVEPGTHINAIGANYEFRRELDSAAVTGANFICTDDCEQVRYESMDLATPVQEGALRWERVCALSDVVCGRVRGRSASTDITLFKSLGVALEDVALAARAYEKARERGIGQVLPDLSG